MQIHSNSDSPAAIAGRHRFQILLALGLVASLILMVLASRGDLSLDEVMTLETALGADHWLAIFTQHADDNNHLLNSFFLRLLGWQQHLFVYRIPAVGFGFATLAALAFTARRWSREATVWVVCLAGLSYPFILYSSEARGYPAAMFFAVAAFEMLQRCWERCSWARLNFYWLLLSLGFLAHFSFVMILLALGGWSVVQAHRTANSWCCAAVNLAKFYAVPAVFVAGVYLLFVRHMTILGGPVYGRWEIAASAAAHALGLPDAAGLRLVAVMAALALAVYGGWNLFQQRRSEWIFFGLVLLVAPALTVVALQPKFLYFRYFLVCLPFFYLLLASFFAPWFRRSGIIRLVPLLLLLAMTTGHLLKISALLELGRGHYRQALEDMAAATPGARLRIGSDSDFKNGKLLRFYGLLLPPAKHLEYVPHEQVAAEKPDWLVVCYLPGYPSLLVGGAVKYDLYSVYPFCGLSGMEWSVYRLAAEVGTHENSTPVKTGTVPDLPKPGN